MSEARQTTGIEILAAAFQVLSPAEQDEAYERLTDARLQRDSADGSEMTRMVRSLQIVAAEVGGEPTVTEYRRLCKRLRAEGAPVVDTSRLIRHFGSWRQAKEALAMSETTTARRIESRFKLRRLDKVWRYTEETLGEVLERCVEAIGHVPQVAEFDWWRQRELELAEAQGNDAMHIPSAGPYRRRWGSWEQALLHFGFTSDEVAERLERQ